MITNSNDVVKDWGQYFEQLFANDDTRSYNNNFKKQVTAKISQLATENQMKEHEVLQKVIVNKENEIRNTCSNLKNGKAGGKDGLKNEHLKYMGQIATNALCTLFSSIIELEYIPEQFKEGKTVTIPKGGGKVTTKKDNYFVIMYA